MRGKCQSRISEGFVDTAGWTSGKPPASSAQTTWRFIGAFFLVVILYVIPFLIVSEIFGQSNFDSSLTGGAAEPTFGTLFATKAVKAIFGFLSTAAGPLGASETMSRCNRVREDGRSASGKGPAPASSTLPHR